MTRGLLNQLVKVFAEIGLRGLSKIVGIELLKLDALPVPLGFTLTSGDVTSQGQGVGVHQINHTTSTSSPSDAAYTATSMRMSFFRSVMRSAQSATHGT
jgi:hypothetical protein